MRTVLPEMLYSSASYIEQFSGSDLIINISRIGYANKLVTNAAAPSRTGMTTMCAT